MGRGLIRVAHQRRGTGAGLAPLWARKARRLPGCLCVALEATPRASSRGPRALQRIPHVRASNRPQTLRCPDDGLIGLALPVLPLALCRGTRVFTTEMVTAQAVLRGDRNRLLAFSPAEHPRGPAAVPAASLAALAEAALLGEAYARTYEINLNVGCPSNRSTGRPVRRLPDGRAGAGWRCVAAMQRRLEVPVTVKCRIGIDEQDSERDLDRFIGTVADAGCSSFMVHARKAWLSGLSPKQNRELVPPLDHARLGPEGGACAELDHHQRWHRHPGGGASAPGEGGWRRDRPLGLSKPLSPGERRPPVVWRPRAAAVAARRAGGAGALCRSALGQRRTPQQYRAAHLASITANPRARAFAATCRSTRPAPVPVSMCCVESMALIEDGEGDLHTTASGRFRREPVARIVKRRAIG